MPQKFYVTTPIYYVNDRPHIGHAYTTTVADFLARYHRGKGDKTFFLTGTDEHGTKNVRAADEEGKATKAYVDDSVKPFQALKEILNFSWDQFIRTSDKKLHWPGAEELWRRIEANGDIYWKEYEGLYCVGCETFVTEKELADGLCPIHKKPPELVKEKNLFFKLSKYTSEIEKKIESDELRILPETRKNEILSLIREGLRDVSFSRPREKLSWGIPVPGKEDQTMYVWCDALANYVSAIGLGRDEEEFEKWWPADVHIIGKDILRFHAAIWPGMLISAGLPLPKRIYVHGFINIEGHKMSKSLGNVIDPVELVRKFGVDAVRYYLLREIPSNEDGNFSEERFKERYQADLANGIGNLASRVSTLGESLGKMKQAPQGELFDEFQKAKVNYEKAIDQFRIHEAVAAVWQLIHFCDGYIDKEKPWESKDSDVIASLVETLDLIATLSYSIIPEASDKIRDCIEIKDSKFITVKRISNLFPRLADNKSNEIIH